MFGVCCVLCVVGCLLCVVGYVICGVRCLLRVCVAYELIVVGCRLLFDVVCCMLFGVP